MRWNPVAGTTGVCVCGCVAVVLCVAGGVFAGDVAWTSFHNNGDTSLSGGMYPTTWSPDAGVNWRISLPGYGQSSPVIGGGTIYVSAVEGDEKELCVVCAYDAATGELTWRREFPASIHLKSSDTVSRAAPTPVLDGSGVCFMFESGDLFALSTAGDLRWSRSLFDSEEKKFQNNHGYGGSPAQTQRHVIVLVDHQGPSYLAAFDKDSGAEAWHTERSSRSSWTSPHVAEVKGREFVIVSSGGSVDVYDAANGVQLWSQAGVVGNTIPSVTISGRRVIVGASEGRRGAATSEEALSNFCVDLLSPEGQKLAPHIAWRAEKAVSYYSSPLVHNDHAYFVNNIGVIRCVSLIDGTQCYESRMGEPCWAQPIGVEDRLYFFGKSGVTKVVRAGPVYELLAENRIWPEGEPPLPKRNQNHTPAGADDPRPASPSDEYLDPLVYAVAAAEGSFYVRLGTHLFRVGGVPDSSLSRLE